MIRSRKTLLAVAALFPFLVPHLSHAQSSNEPALYKAFYLEKQTRDFAAAQALYREVLGHRPPEQVRRIAQAGAERCRDGLAAENFAGLMPADAIGYIELNRPGQLIEKVAGMIGLTTDDMRGVLSGRPSKNSTSMAYVPSQMVISPALFEHLAAFGGVAAAVTDFDPEGDSPPSGVIVLHHGDAAGLKGILETAFQFAPLAEKLGDLPTFGTILPEVGQVTGVLTESLLIVGTGRELVQAAVERLIGERSDSLASRPDLAELASQRKGATLFAYCDLQGLIQRVTKKMSEHDRSEMKVVDGLVDLDSLRWAAFSLGIQDNIFGVQFAVRLADDHRCIAYNLMRLPPMTRDCLKNVPTDAAGVFGMGLNPALTYAAADAAQKHGENRAITGFDIFREFFGNIREVCGFVVPGEMKNDVPNACILMSVNDVAKSRALWDQFLSLPGLVEGKEPIEPRSMKIGSTPVTAYAIPELGSIYVSELDGCIAIGLTRSAIRSAIQAHDKGKSLLDDPMLSKAFEALPRDTSIMAIAHIGRLAKVAAGHADSPGESMQANMAGELCANTIAAFALGQAHNQMTIRLSLGGLPNVNDVMEKFGPMINAFIPAAPSHRHDNEERVVKKEKKRRRPVEREERP
ncbi:hypothetical protein B7486_16020 [cyanobacterium TDX16]|nr:hypothetical protein B7486_16020 [cyanobacterium TDX16]